MASTTSHRTTVAELRAGGAVDGVFACSRKDRLTARSGSAYLALELRDRTGAIPGRAFRNADFLAGQFDRGDLVWVTGRVERFRDELQVDVREIRRADDASLSAADFLPSAYRDVEELDGFLEHLARRSTTRTCAACSMPSWPTPNFAQPFEALRVRAGDTTPTSVDSSNTPWPWPPWPSRRAHSIRA